MKATRKKLLILGGTRISLEILEAAKSMDIDVFVADYNEDSPCKNMSDKSFLVSATDIDAVSDIIKKEKIDGVLMGYADVLLDSYVEICNSNNLPCYATHKAIDITANKREFKKYCRNHGVPTVEEYTLNDVRSGRVKYPIIVKPVDNSGARGIYICNNIDEFENNYKKALGYSKSHDVIIERLMNAKEATVFYYLHNGEAYLLGLGDRWMYEQNKSLLKLPVGYTFPSKNISQFVNNQNQSIIDMFKSLGMKEGMVFIQCFMEDGKYIIYEMGYRLTGSLEHHLMRKQYGFDHLKEIINYAVGNKVNTDNVAKIDPNQCCMANVTLLLKEGKIKDIPNLSLIHSIPGVIHEFASYKEGDSITQDNIGKLSQVGLRVLLTADSNKELVKNMDKIKEYASILDENDSEMIIKDYDYQQLCRNIL